MVGEHRPWLEKEENDHYQFSQSEVVLHSNLQILEKMKKNVSENSW